MTDFEPQEDYIGGRIMEMIDYYGLNKNSFSVKVGLQSNAYIVRIVNNRDAGMSLPLIQKILMTFPEINPEWFILGKGEMLKENTYPSTKVHYIKYFKEIGSKPSDLLKIVGFDDCDVAFDIVGSGMSPKYRHGDIVICKTLKPDDKIPFGEAFFIVSGGSPLIRYIKSKMDDTSFKLGAEDTRYEDSSIPLAEIQSLYLIKGLIRKELF